MPRLRRRVLHNLARAPKLYTWLLRKARPNSVEKQIFIRLVRRGDVVFDVGANIGDYTVLFSDLVGPDGAVHAFEPVPTTFRMLTERIAAEACLPNIVTNTAACSDSDGTVEMLVPSGDLGQASMQAHKASSWSGNVQAYSAAKIRLDDYASEHGIKRLDFMKCDVEGAELLALRGAAQLIQQFQPILHLEVADWLKDFGFTTTDLVNFVLRAGYSKFQIDEDSIPIHALDAELARRAPGNSVNLLCIGPAAAARLGVQAV